MSTMQRSEIIRTVVIFLQFAAICVLAYLLYDNTGQLDKERSGHKLAQEMIDQLQAKLQSCTDKGTEAKEAVFAGSQMLEKKGQEAKRVVRATPLIGRMSAIRKNLVDAGYLPERYRSDTTAKVYWSTDGVTVTLDTTEAAAIQESTAMVTIKKKAWDDLAYGYAVAIIERNGARDSLRNCNNSSLKAEARFTKEVVTRRPLGGFGYDSRKNAAQRSATVIREIRETGKSKTEESELEREMNRKK